MMIWKDDKIIELSKDKIFKLIKVLQDYKKEIQKELDKADSDKEQTQIKERISGVNTRIKVLNNILEYKGIDHLLDLYEGRLAKSKFLSSIKNNKLEGEKYDNR